MIRQARLAIAAGALIAACGGGGPDPVAGSGGQSASSSAVGSTGTSPEVGSGGAGGARGVGGAGGAGARCASDDGSPEHIVQISSNLQTSLAVSSRGRVACWGYSNYYECAGAGGDARVIVSPGWIPQLPCISSVDLQGVGFALDQAGGVWGWGTEFEEELGDGAGASNPPFIPTKVRLGASALSVRSDSLGGHAALPDGTYVWGTVWRDQVWSSPRLWPLAEGNVLFRNATTFCQLGPDRKARCRGLNTHGEAGDGTFDEHEDLVEVATSVGFSELALATWITCGIAIDRSVYCWGYNANAQLGNGTIPSLPVGGDERELSVPAPAQVVGMSDIRSIDVDFTGACALDGSGTVWCWGENRYERFAAGSQRLFPIPVAVPDLSPARQIAVGNDQICALKLDDTVWCRGNGLTRGIASGVGPPEATEMHFDFEAPL